ncbi:hypothetical protein ACFL20_10480 [Spirochaetota bacterium]
MNDNNIYKFGEKIFKYTLEIWRSKVDLNEDIPLSAELRICRGLNDLTLLKINNIPYAYGYIKEGKFNVCGLISEGFIKVLNERKDYYELFSDEEITLNEGMCGHILTSDGSSRPEEYSNDLNEEYLKRGKGKPYTFLNSEVLSDDNIQYLKIIHDDFAGIFSRALGTVFGMPLNVRLQSIEQGNYGDYTKDLSREMYFANIQMDPLKGYMCINYDEHVTSLILDVILGGSGEPFFTGNKLTPIEENIMESIAVRMLGCLRESWAGIIDIRPRWENVNSIYDHTNLLPPQESSIVMKFEVEIEKQKGFITFCIPVKTIKKIKRGFNPDNYFASKNTEQNKGRKSEDSLSAEIYGGTITFGQIQEISEGSVMEISDSTRGRGDIFLKKDNLIISRALKIDDISFSLKSYINEKYPVPDIVPVKTGTGVIREVPTGEIANIRAEIYRMNKTLSVRRREFSQAINMNSAGLKRVTDYILKLMLQIEEDAEKAAKYSGFFSIFKRKRPDEQDDENLSYLTSLSELMVDKQQVEKYASIIRQWLRSDEGRKKAAIVLIDAGENLSSEILKYLNEDDIEKAVLEISRIDTVKASKVKSILIEFQEALKKRSIVSQAGIDYARNILERTLGTQKAIDIVNRITMDPSIKSLSFIQDFSSVDIYFLLRNERPQTIAAVLSCLGPDKAADVLLECNNELRKDIIKRISKLMIVSADVLREIERVFERKAYMLTASSYHHFGGYEQAEEIRKKVNGGTETNVVELTKKDDR